MKSKLLFLFVFIFLLPSNFWGQTKSLFFAGTEIKLFENYRSIIALIDTNEYRIKDYGGTVFVSSDDGKELGSFSYRKSGLIAQVAKDWGKYYDYSKAFEIIFHLIKNLPKGNNYISADEVTEPGYNQKTMRFFSGNLSINVVIYSNYIQIYENISD